MQRRDLPRGAHVTPADLLRVVPGMFVVQRFFMSAAAVDLDVGASEAAIEEADAKRAVAGVSTEIVLAVDSTKLGNRSVAKSLDWEDATFLVTELEPGDARLAAYRELVEVV